MRAGCRSRLATWAATTTFEDWRPIFAAQELYRAALKKSDLVPYDGVWPAVERASACIGVMLESSFMQERGYGDVLVRARNAWVDAAEKALASNVSTVAVLSVDEIRKPDGYVAELKTRGFVVADP